MKPISPHEFRRNTIEDGYKEFPHDVNEFCLVPGSETSFDFGTFPKGCDGLIPDHDFPIRLRQGVHTSNGKGFGITHIIVRHESQLCRAGFDSVQSYVSDVLADVDEVWLESDGRVVLYRAPSEGIALWCKLVLENQPKDSCYAVVSAYTIRPNKLKDGKLIWKKES